jgi:hypothetical protein
MSTRLQVHQKETQAPTFSPLRTSLLRRQCACGDRPGLDGECTACQAKRQGLQSHTSGIIAPLIAPPIVHEVLGSPGQPLDQATRAFMEPRFGHDFSQVRVHTDARAVESTGGVNALAYTVGQDVVFGPGQYAPKTSEGRRLLAHELTHVVQQSLGPTARSSPVEKIPIGSSTDRSEQAADQTAERAMRGADAVSQVIPAALPTLSRLPFVSLQRQTEDSEWVAQGSGVMGGSKDPLSRCYLPPPAGLGCPKSIYCDDGEKVCEVIECGTGACPRCPPGSGLENIAIRAWCAYVCTPSGSATVLITRPFGFMVHFCWD